MPEIDLLACHGGSVTAPAGCGKTQLIADTIKEHRDSKPILVLTHTNAGRSALYARLTRDRSNLGAYRVATIDSWLLRTAASFPVRASLNKQWLRLADKRRDYPLVRHAAIRLLASGDITELLQSTYSRVFVDEYQDCSHAQHQAILELAKAVPTFVLGDPQQSIFGFDEAAVHWEEDVLANFPSVGTLKEPWRWKRVGCTALGHWLLCCREALKSGDSVDLRTAPKEHVRWLRHDEKNAIQVRQKAAAEKPFEVDWTTLVLADSNKPQTHKKLALRTPGLVTVEALEMEDLTKFALKFDVDGPEAVNLFVRFIASLMANLNATQLLRRLETLRRGGEHKTATPHEQVLLEFASTRTYATALNALRSCRNAPGVRVYRPEMFRVLVAALQRAVINRCDLSEAVLAAREVNRHMGRPNIRRAVGSTLLLKGLESDVVVVLNPAAMDAENLYVALTRGSRQLVVCAQSPLLNAAAKN